MKKTLAFLGMLFMSITAVFGQYHQTEHDVRFARGKSSAIVTGVVRDSGYMETYKVTARAGQRIRIQVSSANRKLSFDLGDQNGNQMFDSAHGSKISTLESDGTYRIDLHADGDIPRAQFSNVRFTLKITIL
jgi:hypothetical protein